MEVFTRFLGRLYLRIHAGIALDNLSYASTNLTIDNVTWQTAMMPGIYADFDNAMPYIGSMHCALIMLTENRATMHEICFVNLSWSSSDRLRIMAKLKLLFLSLQV